MIFSPEITILLLLIVALLYFFRRRRILMAWVRTFEESKYSTTFAPYEPTETIYQILDTHLGQQTKHLGYVPLAIETVYYSLFDTTVHAVSLNQPGTSGYLALANNFRGRGVFFFILDAFPDESIVITRYPRGYSTRTEDLYVIGTNVDDIEAALTRHREACKAWAETHGEPQPCEDVACVEAIAKVFDERYASIDLSGKIEQYRMAAQALNGFIAPLLVFLLQIFVAPDFGTLSIVAAVLGFGYYIWMNNRMKRVFRELPQHEIPETKGHFGIEQRKT